LKVVAGLVLGAFGAAVLVSAALWHLLRELDRIDSANDE
jgi:hypothetical protein